MPRNAKVTLFFGEGEFEFALRIAQCVELQEITDAGLMVTLDRLSSLRIKDISHVLRLGLIGAGMQKDEAARLVHRHLVAGEIAACALVAAQVVQAAITGAGDEPLGEAEGSRTSDPRSPTENCDTPTSMALAPSSASLPDKSTNSPSGSSAQP